MVSWLYTEMIFEDISNFACVCADLIVVKFGSDFGLRTTVEEQELITKLCIDMTIEAVVNDVHLSVRKPFSGCFAISLV